MLETEKAYIAGIMDGEGSISIHKKMNKRGTNPTYSMSVTVTNTDKHLLDWIRVKVQAGLISSKPRSNTNWKLCYQLVFRTAEIKAFLEPLIPYMIVRKTQAELMIEFVALEWKQTGLQKEKPADVRVSQSIIHEELLALNKRGS